MTGLCGWALGGIALQSDGARARLSSMTETFSKAGAESASHVSGPASCFVRAWQSDARVVEDSGLIAAIDGLPRWETASLQKIARDKGHAAAVIAAWREAGDGFLKLLKGQFSVALIDVAGKRALLAVDRMGVGRLYHARADDGALVFGSTADAVAAHPGVTSTISEQGLFDYLFFYVSPAPATIYREQSKLLAGQFLIADADGCRTGRYWQMPYREQAAETEAALADQLRTKLLQSVADSVAGEDADRIGAFLSGGLDSSTLVGMLCKQTRKAVKAFTIGFDAAGFDEMPYAALAAQKFGATHVPYYLTSDDLVDAVPRLATGYDEPFGNSSAVPTYCCARVAQENGIGLLIAGDGGDELFAGNERYRHYGIFERYNALPSLLRKGLVAPAVALMGMAGDSRFVGRARSFLRLAEIPMPDRTFAHHVLVETPLGGIFEQDFLERIDPDAPVAGVRELFFACSSTSLVQQMMSVDLQRTLADNDLLKVSRATELAGVEVRYPFMDDDLVALSARIPGGMLMKGNELRGFYKASFRDFLPRETLEKQKHGFGLPTIDWMRQDPRMNEMVMESLSGFRKRGYIRKSFVDMIVENLGPGGSPYISNSAWDIMMLELWLQSRGFRA